jgi:D-serine deaminase-like pyridoxal phosphate-dependent protein
LAEAEVFAAAGLRDILYAVGIAPQKLDRVLAIRRRGCDLMVLLDSVEQARAVAAASRTAGDPIPALIEIDSDGHRAGLHPDDPAVIEVGRILHEGGAELRGVMTHAGEGYAVVGAEAHAAVAEAERAAAVAAAEALRAAGLRCPVVSVGSTPTAHAARDPTGVTEMRAGVHVFFDLVQAGLGVCRPQDIALSVLTTVIGHQAAKGWVLIDAGWMALSQDRGTAANRWARLRTRLRRAGQISARPPRHPDQSGTRYHRPSAGLDSPYARPACGTRLRHGSPARVLHVLPAATALP